MKKISFVVDGNPIPAVRMNRGSKWTDKAQRSLNYQARVALAAQQAFGSIMPEGDYIVIQIRAYRADNRACDSDNITKSVKDGMTYGQIWRDDACVLGDDCLRYMKKHPDWNGPPRTEVTVKWQRNEI